MSNDEQRQWQRPGLGIKNNNSTTIAAQCPAGKIQRTFEVDLTQHRQQGRRCPQLRTSHNSQTKPGDTSSGWRIDNTVITNK